MAAAAVVVVVVVVVVRAMTAGILASGSAGDVTDPSFLTMPQHQFPRRTC